MWDGKQYDGLNLNIDAVKQEAQVYPPGTVTAVVMDRNHIDWLEMGGIRYVNLSKKGYQVNEGFYEVMDQSPEGTVYRQLVKTVKLDLTDAEKKLHASYYFSSAETYYLERGCTLQELRRRRAQRLLRNPRGRSIASAVKPRTKALQPIGPHQQDLLLPADLPAQPVRRHVFEDSRGMEGAVLAAGHETVLAEKDDLRAFRHPVGFRGELLGDQKDLDHDVFPVFPVSLQVREGGRLEAGGLPVIEIRCKTGRVGSVTVHNRKDSSHNVLTSGSDI